MIQLLKERVKKGKSQQKYLVFAILHFQESRNKPQLFKKQKSNYLRKSKRNRFQKSSLPISSTTKWRAPLHLV